MNRFLELTLASATEPQRQEMRQWMGSTQGSRFRQHLEAMAAQKAMLAVKDALASEEMPNYKELSKEHLASAAKFDAALRIWDQVFESFGDHMSVVTSPQGIAEGGGKL